MSIQQLASPVRSLENGHFTRAQALSLTIHIAAITLLLLIPWANGILPITTDGGISIVFPEGPIIWRAPKSPGQGNPGSNGTGGNRMNLPPSHGKLPPSAQIQLAPPKANIPEKAAMQVPATILGPEIPLDMQAKMFGDPRSMSLIPSGGPGGGDGFGDKCCGGVGRGKPGERGFGESIPNSGEPGYGTPVCAYCPNPTFSDEAVKTRFQGKVLLRALVTADGRVTNISLVRGLGMGLDENAIAKVRTWRLTAARGPDGKPAAVWTLIEVIFRQH